MSVTVDVFGEVAIDHIFYILDQKANYKWTIDKCSDIIGGSGANITATYNVIGCNVNFFTGVSTKPEHQELYEHFNKSGIRIIDIAPGEISEIYDMYFLDDLRRTVAVYPGAILKDELLSLNKITDCQSDILHITPMPLRVAKEIPGKHKAEITVLSPAGEFIGIGPDRFRDLIKVYDMLSLDVGEAIQYTGLTSLEDIVNWFNDIEDLCTIITRDALGAICIFENEISSQEAAELSLPLINPMGCGDVFAASFAYYFFTSGGKISLSLAKASNYARCMASIDGMWIDLLNNKQLFSTYCQ